MEGIKKIGLGILLGALVGSTLFFVLIGLGEETSLDVFNMSNVHTFFELWAILLGTAIAVAVPTKQTAGDCAIYALVSAVLLWIFMVRHPGFMAYVNGVSVFRRLLAFKAPLIAMIFTATFWPFIKKAIDR